MALSDYQQKVEAWVQQYRIGYWKPHEILTRLTEETGEVAREVNHEFGPKKKKPDERVSSIGGELADVIFTVCCMANSLGIDLDREFANMVATKLYGRDKDRFEKK